MIVRTYRSDFGTKHFTEYSTGTSAPHAADVCRSFAKASQTPNPTVTATHTRSTQQQHLPAVPTGVPSMKRLLLCQHPEETKLARQSVWNSSFSFCTDTSRPVPNAKSEEKSISEDSFFRLLAQQRPRRLLPQQRLARPFRFSSDDTGLNLRSLVDGLRALLPVRPRLTLGLRLLTLITLELPRFRPSADTLRETELFVRLVPCSGRVFRSNARCDRRALRRVLLLLPSPAIANSNTITYYGVSIGEKSGQPCPSQ